MTATLSPKQAQSIAEAQARLNVWHGAVRSGKTISSIVAWLDYVARHGVGGKLLMVGKTKDTLERNVIDPMGDLLGHLTSSAVVHTRGANTAVILGRLVHLAGANDAKAEGRIRGMTLQGAYVDEATLLPEAFWKMLLTRLSLPNARLFGTTNPDNPRHWLRTDYLENPNLSLRSWHFTIDDNPALTPDFVAQLKAENQGLFYRRFILGEWVQAEGAVYSMWDHDRHVVDILPPLERLWAAVDYGTSNPFSCLLFGLGADGVVYVAREWRHDGRQSRRQMTDAEYSKALRDWWQRRPPDYVFVDPSAASFKVQLRRDGVAGVRDGANDVLDGIRTVASALGAGKVKVHRSCNGLLGEIPGYVWDPKATERGEDAPLKQDDHSVDALRYGLHTGRLLWWHLMDHLDQEDAA